MAVRSGFCAPAAGGVCAGHLLRLPLVKDLTGKQSIFRTQDAVTRRYFRKVRSDEEREEAVLRFRTAGRYFTEFVRWLTELIVTLPPPYVRSNPGEGYAVGGAGGWRVDVPSNELVDGALLALLYKYYLEMPDGRYDAQKPLGGRRLAGGRKDPHRRPQRRIHLRRDQPQRRGADLGQRERLHLL